MPAALIPAAISIPSSIIGGASIATALAYGGINAILSLALSPSSRKNYNFQKPQLQSSRKRILRSSEAPREIVYGRVRKSGLLTFAYSTGREGNLHLVLTLAAHEIDGIENLWIGEEYSSLEKYQSSVSYYLHNGLVPQDADAILLASAPAWTEQHKGNNIAYLHVVLKWNENLWNLGLPDISATIRGKKIYDPRLITESLVTESLATESLATESLATESLATESLATESSIHPSNEESARQFSDNPALCVLDYLISEQGLACEPDEIDWQSFIDAANLCEQQVGGDNRYRCNGIVVLDQTPIEIVEQLLTSCAGVLVYTQGKYKIFAAAPRSASASLGEDNLRANPQGIPRPERANLVNTLRATYNDESENWQPSDITPITNSSYLINDGGKELTYNLELPFTTARAHAERLARLAFEIVRPGARIRFPATLAAIGIDVWDVVSVSLPQVGYENKLFRVLSWRMSEDFGIDLELQEYDPAAYKEYPTSEGRGQPIQTNLLPPPFFDNIDFNLNIKTVVEATPEQSDDGALQAKLVATWEIPSRLIQSISLQWRQHNSVEKSWSGINLPPQTTQHQIPQAQTLKTYDFRLRMVNSIGIVSKWQEKNAYFFNRHFKPPLPPRQFRVKQQSGRVYTSWEVGGALYLHGAVEIRFLKTSNDPEWEDMEKAHQIPIRRRYDFSITTPAEGRHVFAIKSYNQLNIPSEFAAKISLILEAAEINTLPRDEAAINWPELDNLIAFKDEKNTLIPSSKGAWRDIKQEWKKLPDMWAKILPINEKITYQTPVIDIGAIKAFLPTYSITAQGQFTITWRYSNQLPCEGEFFAIADVDTEARFIQFKVQVQGSEQTTPKLIEMVIDEQ